MTATRNTVRLLGGAIWLAVCGAILNNHISDVPGLSDSTRAAIINGAQARPICTDLADPAAVRSTPLLSTADRQRVLHAYSSGFRTIFLALAIFTALACVVAQLLIEQRSLKRSDDAELKKQGAQWLAARRAARASK